MGTISHVKGDIFSAPAGSILVHACNTQGSWGSGIALAFREKYPAQYEKYRAHCKEHGQTLVGSCLLIPGDTHDIACLFTSQAYGRRKDSPDQIVAATRTAVQNLLDKNVKKRALHACRFNSGKFAVPWQDTEAVLKDLKVTMTSRHDHPLIGTVSHDNGFSQFQLLDAYPESTRLSTLM